MNTQRLSLKRRALRREVADSPLLRARLQTSDASSCSSVIMNMQRSCRELTLNRELRDEWNAPDIDALGSSLMQGCTSNLEQCLRVYLFSSYERRSNELCHVNCCRCGNITSVLPGLLAQLKSWARRHFPTCADIGALRAHFATLTRLA
jgi:hypothetical protein